MQWDDCHAHADFPKVALTQMQICEMGKTGVLLVMTKSEGLLCSVSYGGILALRAHTPRALRTTFRPDSPAEPQAHPFQTSLKLGDPNYPSSRQLQANFPSPKTSYTTAPFSVMEVEMWQICMFCGCQPTAPSPPPPPAPSLLCLLQ